MMGQYFARPPGEGRDPGRRYPEILKGMAISYHNFQEARATGRVDPGLRRGDKIGQHENSLAGAFAGVTKPCVGGSWL